MAIRYYKLFDMLNRRGMKKSDLRQIISSATVAKLSKGEYISGEAVDKICRFLECQPGDIMEVIDFEEKSEDTIAYQVTEIIDQVWTEDNELIDITEPRLEVRKKE